MYSDTLDIFVFHQTHPERHFLPSGTCTLNEVSIWQVRLHQEWKDKLL